MIANSAEIMFRDISATSIWDEAFGLQHSMITPTNDDLEGGDGNGAKEGHFFFPKGRMELAVLGDTALL